MSNGEFYLSDAIEVIQEVLNSGGEFVLFPKGTSMLPLIVQGKDRVVLKKYDEKLPQKYDIAFYQRPDGAFVLHRIVKIQKDGTYVMCGDNQVILERSVPCNAIIAYVSEIYKGEHRVSVSSPRYRFYVRRWCFFPYRKTVMFLKRCFRVIKRKLLGK